MKDNNDNNETFTFFYELLTRGQINTWLMVEGFIKRPKAAHNKLFSSLRRKSLFRCKQLLSRDSVQRDK